MKSTQNTTIIIGGGFYGLRVALFLAEDMDENVIVLEKEQATMTRASYVNQARVHNGYHYPRSVLTAYRSKVNFPDFVEEYKDAIKDDFPKYYAVAKKLSKVNAKQFESFAKKIGADIESVSEEEKSIFNASLIEDIFLVKEYAFNSYILRDMLLERIKKNKRIKLITGEEISTVESEKSMLRATTEKGSIYYGNKVLNCTYSQINKVHRRSGLQLVDLKHEIAEMCLVSLPESMSTFSVTVMDGPFFSIMPFPTTPYHTLSHVRYTPHYAWTDNEQTPIEMQDPHRFLKTLDLTSNYKQMISDVKRYIPALEGMRYEKSIWECKTVLLKSEDDDSRPILFRSDFGLDGYVCIMGGKLDNIYDVFEGLASLYGKKH